ncbi:hypothetical protein EMIT091MI3_140085 [Kosakonia quasisacchari]
MNFLSLVVVFVTNSSISNEFLYIDSLLTLMGNFPIKIPFILSIYCLFTYEWQLNANLPGWLEDYFKYA